MTFRVLSEDLMIIQLLEHSIHKNMSLDTALN
jgi:hypothetical protein